MRSIGAIEHEEITVARGLSQQLARLAVNLGIEQDGGLGVVPVVRIVGRSLEVPNQFAGVRIERNNRTGPKIGAFSSLPRHQRIRIAGAPVQQVELRVISTREPRHPATVTHRGLVGPGLGSWFTLSRLAIPSPL